MPEISNIQITNITDHSAIITWTTSESLDSTVFYGLTTDYGSTVYEPTLATGRSIGLGGLTAGTAYHFYVKSQNTYVPKYVATSGDYVFTTLAINPLPDLQLYPPEVTPSAPIVNQQTSVSVRIVNGGAVPINNFVPEYTIGSSSGASDISSGTSADFGFQADTHNCPATLQAYSACYIYFKITFKNAGQKRFYFNLDPLNKISETNESDNSIASSYYTVASSSYSSNAAIAGILESMRVTLERLVQQVNNLR